MENENEKLRRELIEIKTALAVSRALSARLRLRLELSRSYLQIVAAMAGAESTHHEIENAARRGLTK